MCGVAGIVSLVPPDGDEVRRMCDAMVHRGPDGEGYHQDSRAALGMRRLAIIDVGGGGQPFYNEDRTVVAVFNGELYNFRELRADLSRRGHRFNSDSDGECLVHLYEEYGDELVHQLRGMFVFAIWDTVRERLLLARDRVGKKPLYWRTDEESLYFASELKALVLDPAVGREIDRVALHHYLTYQYVPAPLSIYQGIGKVSPGSLLVWHRGIVAERRYWRLDCSPRPVESVEEECRRLRDLLIEATRRRMVSERPVGAFLSGGIDSSAVVAAMAQVSGERLQTFCIGFEDGRFDERQYARVVAQRYGTDHHEMVVTPDMLNVLPTLAWHFDEPFADSSAIPSFYVAKLSRTRVTVVLNGDGGDECFGGYLRYAMMAKTGRIKLPPAVRRGLGHVGSALVDRYTGLSPGRRVGRALQCLGETRPERRYAQLMSCFLPEQKLELYSDAMREELMQLDSYELIYDAFAASRADSDVGRVMDVDVNTYLPGDLLAKVDITTMANSVEARSPFLDQDLMEWAAGLPSRLKTHGVTTKYLLKKAIADWLPSELIERPKKGFGVPMAHWLRTELRDLSRDVLTDQTARSRGYFRPAAVAQLLDEHDAGRDHASRIWALVQFELWHRAFLDRAPEPSRYLAAARAEPMSCDE
jgi:asparagine synthase (glutamine-hydrolysing)